MFEGSTGMFSCTLSYMDAMFVLKFKYVPGGAQRMNKAQRPPNVVLHNLWDNHRENVKVFVTVVQCRFNLGGIRK